MEIDLNAADYVNQRQLALGELLSRQARTYPDREALVFEGRTYTYGDFDRRTDRLANALAARGVEKDGKVALLFFNCSEMVEVVFAACKAGAVNVPLNFRLKGQEILYQLTDSESRVTFFGDEFMAVLEEIRAEVPGMRFVCVGAGVPEWAEPYEDFLASGKDGPPAVPVYDDDPAFIMYTSGTTGRPKGAVLTHKNQMMNVLNCLFVILTVLDEIEQERVQFVGPLFHEAALALCLVTIYQAGAMHILRFFEPEKIMRQIQDFKLTSTFLPPVMSTFLLNSVDVSAYDTSSLRIYISGAAILPTETRRQINAAFPNVNLFDVFGQTEMSPVTCMLKPADAERKTASVGTGRLQRGDKGGGRGRPRRAPGRGGGDNLPRPHGDEGILPQPRGHRGDAARRLVPLRRHGAPGRGGLLLRGGPQEGHDRQRGGEHLPGRDRGGAVPAPRRSLRWRSSASSTRSGASR